MLLSFLLTDLFKIYDSLFFYFENDSSRFFCGDGLPFGDAASSFFYALLDALFDALLEALFSLGCGSALFDDFGDCGFADFSDLVLSSGDFDFTIDTSLEFLGDTVGPGPFGVSAIFGG